MTNSLQRIKLDYICEQSTEWLKMGNPSQKKKKKRNVNIQCKVNGDCFFQPVRYCVHAWSVRRSNYQCGIQWACLEWTIKSAHFTETSTNESKEMEMHHDKIKPHITTHIINFLLKKYAKGRSQKDCHWFSNFYKTPNLGNSIKQV